MGLRDVLTGTPAGFCRSAHARGASAERRGSVTNGLKPGAKQ
jgi:hypothetical protein